LFSTGFHFGADRLDFVLTEGELLFQADELCCQNLEVARGVARVSLSHSHKVDRLQPSLSLTIRQ
jgi:hypothetical protein